MSETAFLANYGQVFRALPYLDGTLEANATRLRQLHVRHGKEVSGVVDRQLAARATLEATLALPETCLLAMIQSPAAKQPAFLDVVETEAPVSHQAEALAEAELERPIRFAIDRARERVLFKGGIVLQRATFMLIDALLKEHREDRCSERALDNYRSVVPEKLAARLGVTEQTLRQTVSRARGSLAEDDVIQNIPWSGYRLNPHLLLVPSKILEPQEDR